LKDIIITNRIEKSHPTVNNCLIPENPSYTEKSLNTRRIEDGITSLQMRCERREIHWEEKMWNLPNRK